MTALRFTDGPPDPAGFAAEIPAVRGKAALLSALYQALRVPAHAGHNWDALFDLLCDLTWLPDGEVMVVHSAVPDLSNDELRTYLSIFEDAAVRLAESNPHGQPRVLIACFPTAAHRRIQALPGLPGDAR